MLTGVPIQPEIIATPAAVHIDAEHFPAPIYIDRRGGTVTRPVLKYGVNRFPTVPRRTAIKHQPAVESFGLEGKLHKSAAV
jgi:hypothetical protein